MSRYDLLLLGLVLLFCAVLLHDAHVEKVECANKGGVLVRGMWNYVCVQEAR